MTAGSTASRSYSCLSRLRSLTTETSGKSVASGSQLGRTVMPIERADQGGDQMADFELEPVREVDFKAMLCPSCGEEMPYYGGSAGFIHCGFKILYRQDGWFDAQGLHVKDDRLAGGTRRVDGDVRKR